MNLYLENFQHPSYETGNGDAQKLIDEAKNLTYSFKSVMNISTQRNHRKWQQENPRVVRYYFTKTPKSIPVEHNKPFLRSYIPKNGLFYPDTNPTKSLQKWEKAAAKNNSKEIRFWLHGLKWKDYPNSLS